MTIQDGYYAFDNDLNSILAAINNCYVISGMAVAEDSPLDMGVVVAAGTYYANGTKVVKGSETDLPLDASDPSLARKDLIVGDSAGTISFVKGTDAAAQPSINTGPETYSPVPPNIPSGKTLLGEVWVGAGANSIVDANITDRRVIVAHLGVDAEKLEASTKAEVRDHTPKAHTLDSHSSKPHSELSDAPANAHHPQSHDLASHSTKAHTELTGVASDQHHAESHAALHENGGAQEISVEGLSGKLADGLIFVRADKDSDGDFDPLTAAAWENSTKDGAGTINLNTAFSVPTAAKMVKFMCHFKDDVVGSYFYLRAKTSTTNPSAFLRTKVANVSDDLQMECPIAADGTIVYTFSAGFTEFTLRVIGWYI